MWDATSKKFRLYPTPDESEMTTLVFSIPESLRPFVLGAISRLAYEWVWEGKGSMTPARASEAVSEAIATMSTLCGLVIAATYVPSNALLCDGATYARDDYPKLWEVLPSGMKTATTFTVPDLRQKFVRGAASLSDIGSTGGSDEHTITVAQMPTHSHTTQPHVHTTLPHSHTYFQPILNIDVEAPGVPDPLGAGSPFAPQLTSADAVVIDPATVTVDEAGGGEPIPTVPSFYALVYVIFAR